MKKQIRDLWALEYEIEEIQTEFAKGIGSINIEELTDDFVEDVMLQSKPLQGILMAIRLRQRVSTFNQRLITDSERQLSVNYAEHIEKYINLL